MKNLTLVVKDEPRVLDVNLAESLGFDYVPHIRPLIERNLEELRAHGNLSHGAINSGKRGRPAKAYYLNEAQALLICMFSRTPNAAAVRKHVIEVFRAYRAGKTVHVDEHYRRPPAPVLPRKRFDLFLLSNGQAEVRMTVPFPFAVSVMEQFGAI